MDLQRWRKLAVASLLVTCCLIINVVSATTTERVAQQPGNVLVDFLAYRHASIVHFDVPKNVISVGFVFTAKEVKTGGLGECQPRDVTINIKSGSLPLVSPDGSRFAAKLLANRRRNYTVEARSNGDEHVVNIPAPPPGDWYAIAYRSWHDPNDGKIKQQGLAASCDTILDAEMSVDRPDSVFPVGLPSSSSSLEPRTIRLTKLADSAIVEFRVPRDTERTSLLVKSSCAEDCSVVVHVTSAEHLLGAKINSSEVSLEFRPYDDESVHYATLRLDSGEQTNLTIEIMNEELAPDSPDYPSEVDLTRKTLPDFFLFDYDHLPINATKPAPFNLTVNGLAVLRFGVGPVYDTGGTLSVGIRLAEDDREDNVTLVGCLSLGYHSTISPRGGCVRDRTVRAADIVSRSRNDPGFAHVPYPEPGVWHLSIRAFRVNGSLSGSNVNSSECECFDACVLNGTDCRGNVNSSNSSSIDECECAQEVEARIESSIASSPCIEGGCSDHGRCLHYMSGGFVFSACHCTGGYRGFDCADDDYVLSTAHLWIRLVLLTASNLAFIGAIVAAVKRHYYTEALVYGAVMFFSTFYHACEAGEEGHSFCLLKVSVLQFCDFYNALLSIWVTLVAMAALGRRTTSFCQMVGVVVLAVGAEMDRTALWVFLLPAFFGCGLVLISWVLKCRQKGTLAYPARIYRLVYLPIGLTIVLVGLICYAFLQTRSNYYIVHSLWHVCVAVGAALLLPKREYML